MNAPLRAPTALALFLAVPLLALPALANAGHATRHKPAHHGAPDFTRAEALASPARLAQRVRETDGLSRNDEDCNFGCVDH
jgi:hypothetical protein